MKMSLAQALKEKNRIVGEITHLWNLVQNQNSVWETHNRSIDVRETMETIELYTEKLIELKTKIGAANEGNLQNMYALEECKSRMAKFGNLDTTEDIRYHGLNDEKIIRRTSVITAAEVIKMTKELQKKCNHLQDALDAYNATHTIEFDSPLI